MEAAFGGIYSIRNQCQIDNGFFQKGQEYTTPAFYNEAERIINGLKALGSSYSHPFIKSTNIQSQAQANAYEEDILNETLRLKDNPNTITFDELKQKAKYAVVINNTGRLMVDGSLYNGIIRIENKNELKHIEYRLGNPITITSEFNCDFAKNKTAIKLTKYEYCKLTPFVTKTEKSLIYEKNWDNPMEEIHIAVPLEIQQHAGITKENNIVKRE